MTLFQLEVNLLFYRLFGVENLGEDVLKPFSVTHKCNRFCHLLRLDVKEGRFHLSLVFIAFRVLLFSVVGDCSEFFSSSE